MEPANQKNCETRNKNLSQSRTLLI